MGHVQEQGIFRYRLTRACCSPFAARREEANIHWKVGCPIRWGLWGFAPGWSRSRTVLREIQLLPQPSAKVGRCHICSTFWEPSYLWGISKENTLFPQLCVGTASVERQNWKQTELLFRGLGADHSAVPCCSHGCHCWRGPGSIYWMAAIKLGVFPH